MDALAGLQREWASRTGDASDSTNPFIALAENIRSWLYGNPGTPGFSSFKARLIVLDSLLAYLCLSGAIATALHVLARRRSNRAVWIVKRVVFPDGTGVVIFEQFALIFVLCVILLPAVGLAHLGTSTAVFLNGSDQDTLNGWRLAGFAPIFLGVWFMSWNTLLGFLLVAGDRFPRSLRGKHLNLVTLGGGAILAAALLVLAAIGGFQGRKIWQAYTALEDDLSAAASQYETARGTITQAAMAVVESSYARWRRSVRDFYTIFKVLLAFFAVLTVAAASVNCCTFALVVRLRQHIRESIDTIAGMGTVNPVLGSDETSGKEFTDISPVSSAPKQIKRADIRRAAAGKLDLGIDLDQAQRLVDLTRVERERLILCIIGMTFCLVIEAYCISSLVIIWRRRRTWVENEVILTFCWWLCGIVGSLCTTALAINELVHMPASPSKAQSLSSLNPNGAGGGGGGSSVAKQVRVDVSVSREVHVAAPGDGQPDPEILTTWSPVSADSQGLRGHKENWA
ncbi:hypothetical protein OIV83_004671 [Microbotryomycetes sp. JL201]|nr:hypothetical protein OIV83_004671 [Microbotryomycetes sp. JL201]